MKAAEYRRGLPVARVMWRDGQTFERIALRLGGSADMWRLLAEQTGEVEARPLTDAQMARAMAMRRKGYKWHRVAALLGAPESEIRHQLARFYRRIKPVWNHEEARADWKGGLTIDSIVEKYGYPNRVVALDAMQAREKKERDNEEPVGNHDRNRDLRGSGNDGAVCSGDDSQ